ncbi:8034_t:CDS:2 [Acaulospora morrowiae]|uniref:8034_t:CDS:1 n=1 Tax=Acaulospora morrowiae TaxID=94023 RepID=A0A9N9GG16_9GLOM|nr:8034_t:CDS:2 [Acaulospora morrowiae]
MNNQDDNLSDINNNDSLMKELYEDVEALCFRNMMNLEEYVDYPEEKNTFETLNNQEILNITVNQELENNESEEEENENIEMRQITY